MDVRAGRSRKLRPIRLVCKPFAHPSRRHVPGMRLAATDLAWRARPRNEAPSRASLPGLVRAGSRRPLGNRRDVLGRLRRSFRDDRRPCRGGLFVVLLETTMLVFAARAATAGLVTTWACTRGSSHENSVPHRMHRTPPGQACDSECEESSQDHAALRAWNRSFPHLSTFDAAGGHNRYLCKSSETGRASQR